MLAALHEAAVRRWLDRVSSDIPVVEYRALWAAMQEARIDAEVAQRELDQHALAHMAANYRTAGS